MCNKKNNARNVVKGICRAETIITGGNCVYCTLHFFPNANQEKNKRAIEKNMYELKFHFCYVTIYVA